MYLLRELLIIVFLVGCSFKLICAVCVTNSRTLLLSSRLSIKKKSESYIFASKLQEKMKEDKSQEELLTLKPHEVGLARVYTSILVALVAAVWQSKLSPVAVQSTIASLWMGCVVGVSLTEAWTKFKAPTLQRHVALDVGRHVFRALNIIESICLLGIWSMKAMAASAEPISSQLTSHPALILLTAVLGYQMTFLTPLLTRQAKIIIVRSLSSGPAEGSSGGSSRRKDESLLRSLSASLGCESVAEAAALKQPSKAWHIVYVLLELLKAGLLGTVAYSAAAASALS